VTERLASGRGTTTPTLAAPAIFSILNAKMNQRRAAGVFSLS